MSDSDPELIPAEATAKKTASAADTPKPAAKKSASSSGGGTVLVGLDLGTNNSCVLACNEGNDDIEFSGIMPTAVGYVPDDIIEGVLPKDKDVFFGDEAVQHEQHLLMRPPLKDGIIFDTDAAVDYMQHIRDLIDAEDAIKGKEYRAVVGVPADASPDARSALMAAADGVFDRIRLIPEPYLATLGYRDDSRLGESNYFDPVTNSIIVDIGAGTTDLCLVQGRFPGPRDQISTTFAGDYIDNMLMEEITSLYPAFDLSIEEVRQIKEKYAYVSESKDVIDVQVIIKGKARTVEVGDIIRQACNELLKKIFDATKQTINKASSRSSAVLLKNIYITGGGSMIKKIDVGLQKLLEQDGYVEPRVRTVGPDYNRLVALGALKAARSTRDNQWQINL